MKSICSLLMSLFFLAACSSSNSPSQSTIQTAIAQTQVASTIIQEKPLYSGNAETLIFSTNDISTQFGNFQITHLEQLPLNWEFEELQSDFIDAYYGVADFTFSNQALDELGEIVIVYKTPEAANRAFELHFPVEICETAPVIGDKSCVWSIDFGQGITGYQMRFYVRNVFVYLAREGKTYPSTIDDLIYTARNIEAKVEVIP